MTQPLLDSLRLAAQIIPPRQPTIPIPEFIGRIFTKALTDPIEDAISSSPPLSDLSTRWLNFPNSGQQLSPWHIANALLCRVADGVAPSVVVEDMIDLASRSECEGHVLVSLCGGGVSSTISLPDDVTILPASSASPTLAREILFDISRDGYPKMSLGPRGIKPEILLRVSVPVRLFRSGSASQTPDNIWSRVQTAIRALTLASGHAFVPEIQTSWLLHSAVPYEGFGGWGTGSTSLGRARPLGFTPREPVNATLAQDIYNRLKTLRDQTRKPIELAIDRLAEARIHQSPADTALDLGIASEIILLHGGEKQELNFRLALRGAHLLATDAKDRRSRFSQLKALYKARSEAAHTGELRPELQQRLTEFDELCSASIRKIVEAGEFPDWDALILGT